MGEDGTGNEARNLISPQKTGAEKRLLRFLRGPFQSHMFGVCISQAHLWFLLKRGVSVCTCVNACVCVGGRVRGQL